MSAIAYMVIKLKKVGIYIYIEGSDLDNIAKPIENELSLWLSKINFKASIINQKYERTPDLKSDDLADWDFGLNFFLSEIDDLDNLVNYIFEIAIKYKRNFIIGYFLDKPKISEDISFFGFESGRLDVESVKQFLKRVC